MLREPVLSDSAVLINEFGAVAIDHHLVERIESGDAIDLVVLKGGCACCAVRGDLVAALRELHARRACGKLPPFNRILLETTGLADPAPLLFTLAADPALRHKFTAGAVLVTVDAVHGAEQSVRHPEWIRQVSVADRLFITKTDLSDAPAASKLAVELSRINPAADVLDGSQIGNIEQLLERTQPLSAARQPGAQELSSDEALRGHPSLHTPDVTSVSIVLGTPLEWSALAVWLTRLLHSHGERILRFKAVLDICGWAAPVALDGVNHLVHRPRHLRAWPAGWRRSRFVFIAQGLQVVSIERSLRASVVRTAGGTAAIAAGSSPIGQFAPY